jgi:hypothetical protein
VVVVPTSQAGLRAQLTSHGARHERRETGLDAPVNAGHHGSASVLDRVRCSMRAQRSICLGCASAVHESWTLICFSSPPSSPRRIFWPLLMLPVSCYSACRHGPGSSVCMGTISSVRIPVYHLSVRSVLATARNPSCRPLYLEESRNDYLATCSMSGKTSRLYYTIYTGGTNIIRRTIRSKLSHKSFRG